MRSSGAGAGARLDSVLEASTDAIYTVDRARTVVTWNRGAERLFGSRAAEAVGTGHDGLFPPHWRAEARDLLSRALLGETIEQHDAEVLGPGGLVVPVSITLRPVRDPEGGIDGVTGPIPSPPAGSPWACGASARTSPSASGRKRSCPAWPARTPSPGCPTGRCSSTG